MPGSRQARGWRSSRESPAGSEVRLVEHSSPSRRPRDSSTSDDDLQRDSEPASGVALGRSARRARVRCARSGFQSGAERGDRHDRVSRRRALCELRSHRNRRPWRTVVVSGAWAPRRMRSLRARLRRREHEPQLRRRAPVAPHVSPTVGLSVDGRECRARRRYFSQPLSVFAIFLV